METRPPIPTELRRRVLVEAGHRCAIPTCRHIEVDVHHITPWSACQCHEYENLIALCPNCHRRADRGDIDRKALRRYKTNLRFLHDKFSQVEMDVLFDLAKNPKPNAIPWQPFMIVFFKRVIEAGYIEIAQHPTMRVAFAGIDHTPQFITITEKGRAFIEDLGGSDLEAP